MDTGAATAADAAVFLAGTVLQCSQIGQRTLNSINNYIQKQSLHDGT